MPESEKKGCGAPATRIVFRGRERRLYLCTGCPYEGSGRVSPYREEKPGEERLAGIYSGPARRCGEETGL